MYKKITYENSIQYLQKASASDELRDLLMASISEPIKKVQ
jgi:hypothetical protein